MGNLNEVPTSDQDIYISKTINQHGFNVSVMEIIKTQQAQIEILEKKIDSLGKTVGAMLKVLSGADR